MASVQLEHVLVLNEAVRSGSLNAVQLATSQQKVKDINE
jgi:predicted Rossmann fold nucleotide-binding protein DprA/Smf involved in DNA uptake